MRQFVAVKFRTKDARSYTYHWDGAPLACGDIVKVPDRSGDGWQRATVHEISNHRPRNLPPHVETKPLLGRATAEDHREARPAPKPETPTTPDLFGEPRK